MRLRHVPRDASRFVRRTLLGIEPPEAPPPEALGRITADLQLGNTFIDVGANIGLFSRCAAEKVGPTGKVLAIEPNPSLQVDLKSALAGLDNVQIASMAVGETSGTATLHVFRHHGRSSLLKNGRPDRFTLDGGNRTAPVVVPVEPLLSILSMHQIEKVDAMKIDIEGYEDRALIPFFATAPQHLWPRRMLIELSPHVWEKDCISDMRSRGYQTTWEGTDDMLLSL